MIVIRIAIQRGQTDPGARVRRVRTSVPSHGVISATQVLVVWAVSIIVILVAVICGAAVIIAGVARLVHLERLLYRSLLYM